MTHALCAIGHGRLRQAMEWNGASPVVFAAFVGGFAGSVAQLCGVPLRLGPAFQQRLFEALLVVLGGVWIVRLVGRFV